ncbi:MAG: cell division protein FtsZ [archaeon]
MDLFIKDALDKVDHQASPESPPIGQATIKVAGVGGAGNNMVSWLHKKGINGASVLAFNTDKQHLEMTSADKKILLGAERTRGLGCGGYPERGKAAAQDSSHEVKEALGRPDMVFICAGMGGGTGTGAAAPIAKMAKELGSIVIGTVTMPFKIERARIDRAEFGLQELRSVSDTVIVIDNNRLVQIAGNLPVEQAFAVANELVSTMIRGIVETIATPSLVNLDYADVKSIMTNGGVAVVGIGASDTEHRVQEAVTKALTNPLLDITYEGATGALIHIEGGPDMTLDEVAKAGEMITSSLDEDANVIWGARINENMKGKILVMTIITGVKSPFILGKQAHAEVPEASRTFTLDNELGIRSM